ncbi:MAG: flagellar basal body P-ring protein FlgI [Nitrospirae bacterium]|nr:flagellar basal body P-ring protein FlgI [Nitrospirota bacterium]
MAKGERQGIAKGEWRKAGRLGFIFFILLPLALGILPALVYAERIKDIATFSGVRENELVGYSLVVGLNGTGDRDGTYYFQPFANMLGKLGINVNPADIKGKTKNIAAVVVTAKLPTMVMPGSKVDVQVSSIGDARSLQGGTLLAAQLKGFDNNVYAVAQGPVSIGGFIAGGGGTQTIKNHPNVGTVPNGAIVEREVPVQLNRKNSLDILLNMQDFVTSTRVANKINERLHGNYAKAEGPSVVSLMVPDAFANKVVDLISTVEMINVTIDTPARVIINERTGTVVFGENVTINPVALAHGSITIQINTDYQVSQPPPLAPAGAQTVVTPQKQVTVEEKKATLVQVKGSTIGELVKALNTLGVTPRDLVAILQAIKAAGSLKAELVIM